MTGAKKCKFRGKNGIVLPYSTISLSVATLKLSLYNINQTCLTLLVVFTSSHVVVITRQGHHTSGPSVFGPFLAYGTLVIIQ